MSNKNKSNEITPPNQVKVAAAPYKSTNNDRQTIDFDVITAHKAMMEHFPMFPETNNEHTKPAATEVEHRGFNVNHIQSNSERNTEDTPRHLAPERQ